MFQTLAQNVYQHDVVLFVLDRSCTSLAKDLEVKKILYGHQPQGNGQHNIKKKGYKDTMKAFNINLDF